MIPTSSAPLSSASLFAWSAAAWSVPSTGSAPIFTVNPSSSEKSLDSRSVAVETSSRLGLIGGRDRAGVALAQGGEQRVVVGARAAATDQHADGDGDWQQREEEHPGGASAV